MISVSVNFLLVLARDFYFVFNNSFREHEVHTTAADYSFQTVSFPNILRLNSCYSTLPTLRSTFPIDQYSAQF